MTVTVGVIVTPAGPLSVIWHGEITGTNNHDGSGQSAAWTTILRRSQRRAAATALLAAALVRGTTK